MAKKENSSIVNFASVVAVFIAIIVFALQLIVKYLGLSIPTNILGILQKIKDVCLVLVVACCAWSYARSLKESAKRTVIYIFTAIFVVLAIVGIVLI